MIAEGDREGHVVFHYPDDGALFVATRSAPGTRSREVRSAVEGFYVSKEKVMVWLSRYEDLDAYLVLLVMGSLCSVDWLWCWR